MGIVSLLESFKMKPRKVERYLQGLSRLTKQKGRSKITIIKCISPRSSVDKVIMNASLYVLANEYHKDFNTFEVIRALNNIYGQINNLNREPNGCAAACSHRSQP